MGLGRPEMLGPPLWDNLNVGTEPQLALHHELGRQMAMSPTTFSQFAMLLFFGKHISITSPLRRYHTRDSLPKSAPVGEESHCSLDETK